MISLLSRAKRILSTIIPPLFYIPLIAFLTNILTLAFLGRELAIEINGGVISLTTYYYNVVAITLLVILLKIRKYRRDRSEDV